MRPLSLVNVSLLSNDSWSVLAHCDASIETRAYRDFSQSFGVA